MFVNVAVRGSDELNTIFTVQGWEDRFLLPLWGLVWIFVFVVFQSVVLNRISNYLRNKGARALFDALKMPGEAVKSAFALLFGFGYLQFLLGHYPFPSRTHFLLDVHGVWGLQLGRIGIHRVDHQECKDCCEA